MADNQGVQTFGCILTAGFYIHAPNQEAADAAASATVVYLKLPGGELQAWPSEEVCRVVQKLDGERQPQPAKVERPRVAMGDD